MARSEGGDITVCALAELERGLSERPADVVVFLSLDFAPAQVSRGVSAVVVLAAGFGVPVIAALAFPTFDNLRRALAAGAADALSSRAPFSDLLRRARATLLGPPARATPAGDVWLSAHAGGEGQPLAPPAGRALVLRGARNFLTGAGLTD